MPSPLIGGPDPDRMPSHAARRVPLTIQDPADIPRPRGEIAVELPNWDLLPPVEFVRRRRTGRP